MHISILTDSLKQRILKKSIVFTDFDDSRNVLLANSSTTPECDNVYISIPRFIPALTEKIKPEDRISLFVAGDMPDYEQLAKEKGFNLITVDMDITEMHNKLCKALQDIQEIRNNCLMDIMHSNMPFNILARASETLAVPIFLLNRRMEVIHEEISTPVNDSLFDSLHQDCLMNLEMLLEFNNEKNDNTGKSYHTVDGGICWTRAITDDENVLYYFVVMLREEQNSESFSATLNMICDYIEIQAKRSFNINVGSAQTIATLLDTMMENPKMNPEELRVRLKCLEYPVGRFFTTIIIFPNDSSDAEPLTLAQEKIREFFPTQNIGIYHGAIVILYCRESFFLDVPEMSKLEKILSEINYSAVVNNPISNWTNLYTNYRLSLSIMNIALTMNRGQRRNTSRVFTFEDYSTYLMINLCQQSFERIGLTDDALIYLGTPSLTSLIIYDNMNGDNLVEVLYHYLLNEKNAIKTGEAIYMHRNTVRKKLSKIKEIMEVDIDDPSMHFRLLFSCILLQYYRNYLCRPFLATPRSSLSMDSLWPTFPIKL